MARISVASVDATRVVTVRPLRRLAKTLGILAAGLGGLGGAVAAGALRDSSVLAAVVALPFLALAAWLAWHALWSLTGSVRIIVEPEGIVIERRYAGYTVARQTATRAEVACLEIVQPRVDREEDDTDDRSFVRIARTGGGVLDIGFDLRLSDGEARALGSAMMREDQSALGR